MGTDLTQVNTDNLIIQLEESKKKLASIPKKWSVHYSEKGKCDGCYDEESEKEKNVIQLEDKKYCKEHYSDYTVSQVITRIEEDIKECSNEIQFRKMIDTVTKTSQIKDIVKAVKEVIKRERRKGYGDKSTITDQEKENAKRLLKLLKKLRPKSSVFIDRGVAINEDLFLSGTITDRGNRYGSRPKNKITLTALDQDERYKSIARVTLTIQQAERLRNMLVDVIEHVKIYSLIDQIGTTMNITIKDDNDDPFTDDEEE